MNRIGTMAIAMLIAALLLAALPACAETALLPEVAVEMTEPDFWAKKAGRPDAVLAELPDIEALNAAFLAEEACYMTDLAQDYEPYDGASYRGERVKQAMSALSEYMASGFFRADGEQVRFSDVEEVLKSIDDGDAPENQEARYGICVTLADVRAVPTDLLITDMVGDNDYDTLQYSYVRVNEPVVIRAQTADGSWYYCDTWCVCGWIRADHIAVCKDRQEWLSAWQIPQEELLVVTEGKLFLDSSNVNAASSQRMLTMGTTLRRVKEEDFDPTVTNRAVYHNTAAWLPVRDEEGRYATTIALIPQHCGVSMGYLPLTTQNIMDVAFSMLGDAYGWGGMLAVPDCSQYIRNIYKCFGLEIPRNTTWQSAMPALKAELGELDPEEKAKVLDDLPAGTILFFRGHEMMYLGEVEGLHYVISSVGSIMAPGGDTTQRIRGVIINTLEQTVRGNGNTWLEDLNAAVQPWLPAADESPVAAFEGEWVAGRALLTIDDLDDVIYCTVNWGGSAFDSAVWEYEAAYDEVSGELTTLETGVKSNVTYGKDGEILSSEVEYDDGAAAFTLNDDGTLTWTNFKETPGENEMVFEKAA